MKKDKKQGNIDNSETSTRGGAGKPSASVDKKESKNKRLTRHQWGELIALLKSGHYTQIELAQQYGVSVTSIIKHRVALGGVGIGENSTSTSSLATIDKTVAALDKVVGFGVEEAGRLITLARRKAFQRNESIGKAANHFFLKSIKDGNLESIESKIKVLQALQTLFEKELRLTGTCLGFRDGEFDTATDLPVLTISKMTNSEIEEVKNRIRSDDDEIEELVDDMTNGLMDELEGAL